jgi:hypothetical protein
MFCIDLDLFYETVSAEIHEVNLPNLSEKFLAELEFCKIDPCPIHSNGINLGTFDYFTTLDHFCSPVRMIKVDHCVVAHRFHETYHLSLGQLSK